jgi:hypothetical protein
MEKSKINVRFGILSLIVLLAAFSRLIPHPPNFAPIGAMSLFGAAYFARKHLAFVVPIVAMWLSDLLLNNVIYGQYFDHFVWFYQGCYWTYAAFIFIGLIGFGLLKKVRPVNLLIASLSASVVFFLVSNFGVWASGTMYPNTLTGLMSCYTAGLPFFKNTLMGDLAYSGALFGIFELIQYKVPALKIQYI